MKFSKHTIISALLMGAIPVMGWLISIPYNWQAMGNPFTATGEWNNLPLWIVTLPLNHIAGILFSRDWFPEYRYCLILIYTLICSIIYAVIGIAVSTGVQSIIRKLKKNDRI